MHLLPWMNDMLDFICMHQSRYEEHGTSENNKMQKPLSTVGFEPRHGTISSLQIHHLSHMASLDCYEWIEKGRDLTQSYDKSPYIHKKKRDNKKKNETKNFDYTTIADRLRTVI